MQTFRNQMDLDVFWVSVDLKKFEVIIFLNLHAYSPSLFNNAYLILNKMRGNLNTFNYKNELNVFL